MTVPSPVNQADMVHMITSAAAIATVLYMPVLKPGRVKDFHVVVGAALATANEAFQLAYAPPGVGAPTFTDITNATVTQLTASSAAGINVRQQLSSIANNYVQDGGTFRITPSGGGSAGVPLTIAVTVGP